MKITERAHTIGLIIRPVASWLVYEEYWLTIFLV
jgi:hypothetical protein